MFMQLGIARHYDLHVQCRPAFLWLQTDGGGSIDLDAGSQEILALLSSGSQGNLSQGHQSNKLPAALTNLPGSRAGPAVQTVCVPTIHLMHAIVITS